MRDRLLVLWIATMAADRIDLLAGSGPFTLPPYMVLMPLLLVLEVPALAALPRVEFRREGQLYLALAATLGALALASAVGSTDPMLSAKRAALLIFQLHTILFVAVVLANRPDPGAILVRGAYLGLALNLFFNAAQIGVWLSDPGAVGGGTVVDLVPGRYGSLVPRLAGQTLDPNRGAMVTAALLFFIYRFGKPRPARGMAAAFTVLSLIASLSRSAVLGAFGILAMAVAERRRLRLTRGRVAGGLMGTAAAVLALFAIPGALELLAFVFKPVTERFSTKDHGNSLHFEMLARALEVAGESPKNALIGIGYGNAGQALTDVMRLGKYANFHSQYGTLLAETGVVALAVGLIIMVYPAVKKNPFRPLAVGFLLFNIFYQLLVEPLFWLTMSCAWLGVGALPRDTPPPPGSARAALPLAEANAAAG